MLKLDLIQPNKEQPRKTFDEEQINELAGSIKQYGVLQPLLVQKSGSFYEIIAGERRWRAAKAAGLKEVPAVLKEYSRQEAMEISLIENVQRADLNPIEEALAYQQLIREFDLTQEEIAARVAKSRVAITNTMRLLKLDEQIQNMLIQGVITSGHARAFLSLEDKGLQLKAAKEVLDKKLSVRETEKLVKRMQREAAGGGSGSGNGNGNGNRQAIYRFRSKSTYARYTPTALVCIFPATICRTAPAAGTPESRPTGWPCIRTEGQDKGRTGNRRRPR